MKKTLIIIGVLLILIAILYFVEVKIRYKTDVGLPGYPTIIEVPMEDKLYKVIPYLIGIKK